MKFKTLTLGSLIATVLVFLGGILQSTQGQAQTNPPAEDDSYGTADQIKELPYRTFGTLYYRPKLNYPVATPWFPYTILTNHKINPKPSALNAGADESGWVPVPVKEGVVYYRAEYHLKDLVDVSVKQDIDDAKTVYQNSAKTGRIKTPWRPTGDQQNQFEKMAKLQIVVFPTDSFRTQFFPGTTLLKNELGSMTRAPLDDVRGGIRIKSSHVKVTKDMGVIAGLFKGTYDNIDTIRGGLLPGLIVDGLTVDAPLAELATLAIYTDGTTRIGRYETLPKAGIQMLRQNEYPVVEDGKLNIAGAYPVRWNRFEDDIIRSYMFTSADGKYVGYAWTNFMHPSFLAKIMQKMNFSDVMLLDIHPVVGAAVRKPVASASERPADFFTNGSYPLVPMEAETLDWFSRKAAEAYRGAAMQWNYKAAQSGSPNDFIGVFVK